MTNDKELVEVWRKQFEEIRQREGCANNKGENGDYLNPIVNCIWQGFLIAKRTQTSVVLPCTSIVRDCPPCYENELHKRLTAAGIKYTIGE